MILGRSICLIEVGFRGLWRCRVGNRLQFLCRIGFLGLPRCLHAVSSFLALFPLGNPLLSVG